MEVILNLS